MLKKKGKRSVFFWKTKGDSELWEESLIDIVVHDFLKVLLLDVRKVVLEPSGLNGGSIDCEGSVLNELRVDVRGERGGSNSALLAEVGPRLEVLLVGSLCDLLQSHNLSSLGHECSIEASFDGEELLNDLVDASLVGIALICKVEDGSTLHLHSCQPDGFAHILHVDSVHCEVCGPEILLLLSQGFVNCPNDDARSQSVGISWSINNG